MALTILNEQYPPRKPKLTLTADSMDELPTEGVAEGSTATVGGTEYRYDSNAGWIEPGSGGGGGGAVFCTFSGSPRVGDKTWGELYEAMQSGKTIYFVLLEDGYGHYEPITQFTVSPAEPPEYSAMAQNVGWLLAGTADGYPTEDMG